MGDKSPKSIQKKSGQKADKEKLKRKNKQEAEDRKRVIPPKK